MMNLLSRRPGFAGRLLLPLALALVTLACAPASAADDEPVQSPITTAGWDAIWWGDFAALERGNAEYRKSGRFDPDGASQLGLFRQGVAQVFDRKVKDRERLLKEVDILTLQWAREHPRSGIAHALHARALLAHGQSYRGTALAKEVPPEAWKFHHDYLQQAAAYLRDHADVALTDSYSHYVLIQIGKGLSWDNEQLEAIAEDGLKRNPEDVVLHQAMVDSLLPKWGGNAKVLDSYIRKAAVQTRPVYGSGMYAMLYSDAAAGQYGSALFEDSHADWDKMKQAYEDILARFPASAHQRNRYAWMACIAKDKATLLRLLGEIGDGVRLDAWGNNPDRSFETCQRMARET